MDVNIAVCIGELGERGDARGVGHEACGRGVRRRGRRAAATFLTAPPDAYRPDRIS